MAARRRADDAGGDAKSVGMRVCVWEWVVGPSQVFGVLVAWHLVQSEVVDVLAEAERGQGERTRA